MAASTTKLLLNTNAKNLKAILFPANVTKIGQNVFYKAKITAQLKQINNANKKVLKSKATKEALIKEIKDLYAKLHLGSTVTTFLTTMFTPIQDIAPAAFIGALAPFKNLYTEIRQQVPGKVQANLNEKKLKSISNIQAKIAPLNTKQIPAGAGAGEYGVKKLYQLYLIVYYLNKLVNMDDKNLQKEGLMKHYNICIEKIQSYLTTSTIPIPGAVVKNIEDFIKSINDEISNDSKLIIKLNSYKDKLNAIIIDKRINTTSHNEVLRSIATFNLIFYAKKIVNNIFDYTYNFIMGTPNNNQIGRVNVQTRNVIKNVQNKDSRKILLQLIKVLGTIMPEFKSNELRTKLKRIKNSTNPLLVENLNKSLINFLK